MEVGQHRYFTVAGEEVLLAVRSFPRGSVGGPDGLRPQHLKDVLADDCGHQSLFPALTSFFQLVLEGRSPTSIQPFFFGAYLTTLPKKQGGIRPIAVGWTLRHLAAKVARSKVKAEMGVFLLLGNWGMVSREVQRRLFILQGSSWVSSTLTRLF